VELPGGLAGEENLSVVVAPIMGGFKLGDLGGPQQAAERFLATTVAPEGSGRTAKLFDTYERCALFSTFFEFSVCRMEKSHAVMREDQQNA